MHLSQIKDFLIYDFKSESELIQAIDLLAKNFTSNRDDLSKYLDNPKMVAAYTAFYMITNYPKLEAVMQKLEGYDKYFIDKDIVDIGCGPGTFLLALRNKYSDNKTRFIGVETSAVMRKQAKKLANGLGLENIFITDSLKNLKLQNPSVIFGHSINEMGHSIAMNYIKKLNPESILIIEPGTKQAFSHLIKLRDEILSRNFNMIYPCPSAGPCPMSESDWCHQYVYVKQDEEIARISQMAKKNRNLLPLTIHAYTKESTKVSEKRVVRYLQETKHSYEYQTCEFDNVNSLKNVQVTKRGMSKKEIKEFKKIYAGDSISYELLKELKDSTLRVKLIKP